MFDFVRVSTNILDEARLDSSYYSNRFLENEEKLANCSIAREEVFKLTSLCNCGSTPKKVEYSTDGVGLIRTSDVRPNRFILDKIARSNDCDIKDSTTAKAGDMLYTMSGTIGYACVIPEMTEEFSFSNTIARVRLPEGSIHDIHYISTFFNSHYGYEQSLRLTSGAIQGHVMPNPFKRLKVSLPASEAQKYIGEKVRQAERLRAWAKNAEKVFNQALKSAYPNVFNKMGSGNCYSFARSQEIDYTLNVGAFDEERLLTQRYLYEHGGRKLAEIAKIANESTSEYEENQVYIGLSSIASHSCELKPSTIAEQEVTGTCRILKSGPVVAKLRPYLNKVSYIPEKLSGSLGSTELLCIEPNKDTSGWFIYGVLKSELTLKQLRPLASGATHPRIDQYDLRNIVIPSVENPHELGQLLEQAQTAYFLSEKCTKLAKLLVEDLIEGQLNESQLASAQQALETGDDSLDRALLERMTAEGIDGEGDPLFDDIEQLYDLLEQAKQALDADNAMAEA
ncbi:restriction endonuclease subunit S [Vibrio harveyi]|uniref:restriction endonuclease subunit S n=1 Tax=Vibrio harveyi TaxID=669 RepID=UPI000C7D7EFE|nr:restriction endonuclease subunit S [Vibrio harveyi]